MMRLVLLFLLLLKNSCMAAATIITTTGSSLQVTASIEAIIADENTPEIQQQQQQQQLITSLLEISPAAITVTRVTTKTTEKTMELDTNKSNINNHKNIVDLSNNNSDSNNCSSSSCSRISKNNTLINTLTTSFDFNEMDLQKIVIVAASLVLILITIVGNTLVILSVVTTRRLRTVTNCFVMNLAITDWLVGMCVMPPAVIYYVVGSWQFGSILCDIWISLDVLLCTGSILSLCAISLDRYLAVTQPLTYSKKRRSKRLALFMIFIVWVTALSITCPPFLGWYEPGRRREGRIICRYNQNKGYVVFSAMGSFFIPLSVMLYVYLRIGYVLNSRRQRIVRDANSERAAADHDIDGNENFLSESESVQCIAPKFRWSSGGKDGSIKCSICSRTYKSCPIQQQETSFYELVEIPRHSPLIPIDHCSTNGSCGKFNGPLCIPRANTLPITQSISTFQQNRASFPTTCAAAMLASDTRSHTHLQRGHHSNRFYHHHPRGHVAMRISTTKHETKTAKTLTIVMGGFIACWLPFFVYYLLMPFLPPAAVCEGLMSFLTWVGWINCGINPFIYAFYNPDFRIAFWRLTCRRICKQQQQQNHLAIFRG